MIANEGGCGCTHVPAPSSRRAGMIESWRVSHGPCWNVAMAVWGVLVGTPTFGRRYVACYVGGPHFGPLGGLMRIPEPQKWIYPLSNARIPRYIHYWLQRRMPISITATARLGAYPLLAGGREKEPKSIFHYLKTGEIQYPFIPIRPPRPRKALFGS